MSDQPTSLFSTGPGPGSGYGQPVPRFGAAETEPLDRSKRRTLTWNGGTDLGLILLRIAVGGMFAAHGAQKVFGLWGGTGLGGFTRALDGFGYRDTGILALVASVGEIAGGAAVVLGLLTPFAAAGLVGIAINAVLLNLHNGFFIASPTDGAAVEYEVVLGLAAAAIVFTGPGRIALDNGRTWQRRPAPWGFLCLVIGVAAALVVFFLLRAH